jgi:hypothetical protein
MSYASHAMRDLRIEQDELTSRALSPVVAADGKIVNKTGPADGIDR